MKNYCICPLGARFFHFQTQWNQYSFCVTNCFYFRIPLSNNCDLQDVRTEPKYIVFLSKLLLLFQFCHFCSGSNPTITATQTGSAITIKAICAHSGCRKEFIWNSQPMMPGTKILAGNFLISMSTLFAGGSFTKVRTIFMHMGLACISLKTFFKHQQVWDYIVRGQ